MGSRIFDAGRLLRPVLAHQRSIRGVVTQTSDLLGRPIQLAAWDFPPSSGVTGLLFHQQRCETIVFPSHGSKRQQITVIGHEMGHLLLDHEPVETRSLVQMFDIDSSVVARMLAREHYDRTEDREAELVGTRIAEALTVQRHREGLWECLT